LAPPEFLVWLAEWVGLELDDRWPPERQRALVRRMIGLYRSRGTVDGLREHVELVTGGQVEVEDNGGVLWSTTPGTGFPDGEELLVTVRVHGMDHESVGVDAVDALVASAKPAHVPHRVEVAAL
jgi:phage tail P2-like protein